MAIKEKKNVLLVNREKTKALELLREKGGLRICAISPREHANLYQAEENVGLVDDHTNYSQVADAAEDIAQKFDIDSVIAASESSVPVAGFLRSLLGVPGTPFEVSINFSRKGPMKRALQAAGIPVAKSQRIRSLQLSEIISAGRTVGWPLIIKPEFGAGAYQMMKIDSEIHARELDQSNQLSQVLNAEPRILGEQFIEIETEFHSEAVIFDGVIEKLSVSKYFNPQLFSIGKIGGQQTLKTTDPGYQKLVELHTAAVHALGLSCGVTHMEVFKDSHGEWFVGEIALRPVGNRITDAVMLQYGIDLWRDYLDIELGIYTPTRVQHEMSYADNTISGVIWLPARTGVVCTITEAYKYLPIPGVIKADVLYQAGDNIAGKVNTAFNSTYVIYQVRSISELETLKQAVRKNYRLELVDGTLVDETNLGEI